MLNGDDLVRGFEKQVERLRIGHNNRERQKQQIEEIPRGEHYEKLKKSKFRPPTFLERPKTTKRQPFYYIDVNIGGGKRGKIALYEGDDPSLVAKNFAKTFQLSAEMREDLFQMLKNEIEQREQEKSRTPSN